MAQLLLILYSGWKLISILYRIFIIAFIMAIRSVDSSEYKVENRFLGSNHCRYAITSAPRVCCALTRHLGRDSE